MIRARRVRARCRVIPLFYRMGPWKKLLLRLSSEEASFTDGFAPGTSAIHGGRMPTRPGLQNAVSFWA
jgi:hypothetical protein